MKTQTVGELLAAAREKAGLSLAELSAKTHIRSVYLQALENNDFDSLPEAVFVKAYIRHYARLFNLDLQPLLAVLRRDYDESSKGQLIPREYLYPVIKKNQFWSPVRMLVLSVMTIFAVFLSYAAWQWYQLNKAPDLFISQPSSDARVGAEMIVSGQTDPEAIVFVNDQPVALQADGSFSTQLYFPEEGPNTITVKATDKRGKSSSMQRSIVVDF